MAPLASAPDRAADAIAGRRLMIGMLVVFFGLAFTANGLIVFLGSRSPNPIEASYTHERR